MATVKGVYNLIKQDQLKGIKISVMDQAIIDACEADNSKTTKEVNLTFIKYKKDGGENGNN